MTRWILLLSALASAGLVGCGPDIDNYCKELEDCRGGNDKDVDACVAGLDALGDASDDLDCDSEFSDVIACYNDNASCKSNPSGPNCMTTADCGNNGTCSNGQCVKKDWVVGKDDCDVEQKAFSHCTSF